MDKTSDERFQALTARLDRLERRSTFLRRALVGSLVALVLFTSAPMFAQVTWAPPGFKVFTADTPALADEVNTNFKWLIENPGSAFLTTSACPTGYTAYEGGQYIRLGPPSLAPVARTLVTPAHRHDDLSGVTTASAGAHTHTYGDYYWTDTGNTDLYGTPTGDGSGELAEVSRSSNSNGSHTHTVSGRVGPAGGVAGDSNIAITGELQHITLRLCVKT